MVLKYLRASELSKYRILALLFRGSILCFFTSSFGVICTFRVLRDEV